MSQSYQITVYCLAFNHEPYIRQTLEGFVSQKTDFPFKVIVHDDASTDGTRAIIEEYAQKYPSIIFPILQEENQYSKGVKIFHQIIAPLIDTKYVAACEGDDYWCDENKLQMQYDYMESHPACRLCVHDTKYITADGQDMGLFTNGMREDGTLETDAIIAAGGGGLFHTSATLYRFADRMSLPSELLIPRIGDYPLAIYLSSLGEVHYIGRVMSARRCGAAGSWTANNMVSTSKRKAHYEMMLNYLEKIDRFFNGRYRKGVTAAVAKHRYLLWLSTNRIWRILLHKDTRAVFRRETAPKKRAVTVAKCSVKRILCALHLRG